MLLIEPRYKDTEQGRPTRYKFILSENKFERAAVSDIAVGKWYAFEQAESSFLKSFNELLFTSVIAQTSSERGVRKCPPSSNCARTVSPTIVTIPSDETKIDSLIQIK
ncbi:MAG: hypothetical protein IPO27_02190 [Bacteroidetes bacterium]|nr:hypothetical protein [Bacteroidota bacterium]